MGLIVHGSDINGLSEKIIVLGKWVIQDPECHILPQNSGLAVRIVLHNERGQERHGNYIDGFSKRNLIWSSLVILEQKWYGVLLQAKKKLFFRKFALKTTLMPPMSIIGPGLIFLFLILILYIIYIGQQQVLFITQEQLGNFYSATSTFKCQGSTATVFVCEYLFTFSSFISTIRVKHGKVYF